MRKSHLVFALLAACGQGHPSQFFPGSAGKADGRYEVRDVGPLNLQLEQTIVADGFVPALRIESFGKTRVTVDLAGSDLYYAVVGPTKEVDDAPNQARVVAEGSTAASVTLAEAGVFHLLVGPRATLTTGEAPASFQVTARAHCDENCSHPTLPLAQFLAQEASALEPVLAQLGAQIDSVVSDPATRDGLKQKLASIKSTAATRDTDASRAFTLPLSQIEQLRALIGLSSTETPSKPDEVLTGDLNTLLGACEAVRSYPDPVNASLKDVGYGDFPNLSLHRCTITQSEHLAKLLTSLAVGNDSVARYRDADAHSPRELIQLLVNAGHRVEIATEHSYADFLSFTYKDANIRFPVWLDTGIVLPDGKNLIVPTGHSQIALRISGPDVNTSVRFYLGLSGAGFASYTQRRGQWSGLVANDTGSTVDGNSTRIFESLDVISHYLRRNRAEAAGLPRGGYGLVGVCNDSVALVEALTLHKVTSYPLLRDAKFDATRMEDGLDDALVSLPHDAAVQTQSDNSTQRDALRRILSMLPMELDSPDFIDEPLRAQMKTVSALLATSKR